MLRANNVGLPDFYNDMADMVVLRARMMIENPKHWCRDTYARDRSGNDVWFTSDHAYSFCAGAAVSLASKDPQVGDLAPGNRGALKDFVFKAMDDRIAAYYRFMEQRMSPSECIGSFNDRHGHGVVLKLFDNVSSMLNGHGGEEWRDF